MTIQRVVCDSAADVATTAAAQIADVIGKKPDAVLGLATGSTPVGTYAELIRLHRDEGLSFAGVTTFNLDEYWELPAQHEQSYRRFMDERLFGAIDIPPDHTHVLDGMAPDAAAECAAFEARIAECGGVDLWLLGIGSNGHIAFNEPGSAGDSRTRLVELSPETIAANSDGRFFDDPADVPRQALTAGIGTIRDARRVLLLATGAGKAPAVTRALNGPVHADCPASWLQDHEDCAFYLDTEAASTAR